jgi:glycosyltransferase involved in cell wall biosynthesis
MLPQKQKAHPVLIVDLVKRYGGAEVRVLELARSLQARQHPYAVATLAGSPLHQRLKTARLATLPVPFGRGDPRILFFLRRAIRQAGYVVIDAHNVQSQFWGHLAAMAAGTPVRVSTIHSAYRFEHNGSLKGRAYEQVLRLNRWLGVNFIAVSEAVQAYLQNVGIPRPKISLIPNSIELPHSGESKKGHLLLKELGWDKAVFIVIVVARLEPVKGHKFLIEAFSRVGQDYPQLRGLIVGEGRARTGLEQQVARPDSLCRLSRRYPGSFTGE